MPTQKTFQNIKRGSIYLANLEPVKGREQGKIRPVIIIQNDIDNRTSPTVISAAITSKSFKGYLTDIEVSPSKENGLKKTSVILINQIRTLDKSRLLKHLGQTSETTTAKVDMALQITLGLIEF